MRGGGKRAIAFFIVLSAAGSTRHICGMNIRQRHLSSTQFFRQIWPKKNIVLHHTVSSNAMSPLRWWAQQKERIGTAFIVDKDGTIYEAFEPRFWAHHLGIKSAANSDLNRRSIGIEIVNEGYLFDSPAGPRWLHANGPLYVGPTEQAEWRGGKLWPVYNPDQVAATAELVGWLLKRFNLPATFAPHLQFDMRIPDQYTVYAHHNVRIDKTDTHPGFPYDEFQKMVRNEGSTSDLLTSL